MKKYLKYIGIIFTSALISSCEYEEPDAVLKEFDGTAQELILQELEDVDLFLQASQKVNLDTRLTSSEQFTFFAPTDAAFQTALEANGYNTVEEADEAFLTDFLNNHTVAGLISSGDLTKTSVSTVGDDLVYVSVLNGVVLNAEATVVDADNASNNAIIHVIDFPLLSSPTNTIAEIVINSANDTENPEFTTLLAALEATGLDSTLASTGSNFTVFAPTDAVFALYGLNAGNIAGLISTEGLTEILSSHVFPGRNFTMDLSEGRAYTILGDSSEAQGFDIAPSATGIDIEAFDGDISTTSVNLLATNGTIHVIGDFLMLPEDYLFDAVDDGDGTFVSNGLDNATDIDFDSLLSSEVEYTILSVDGFPVLTEPQLSETINNHILEGVVNLEDAAGTRIEALGGAEYYVTISPDDDILINGRQESPEDDYDIEAYNGLYSIFDMPLTPLPEQDSVTEVAALDTDLDLFNAAVEFLELEGLANATYLYVPNAQFADAYDDAGVTADVDSLQSADLDVAVLEEIVNRHIVTSIFFSSDLEPGLTYNDRNGNTVEIAQAGADFGILTVEDGVYSTIPFDLTTPRVDFLGANGVYHVIGAIIPEPES